MKNANMTKETNGWEINRHRLDKTDIKRQEAPHISNSRFDFRGSFGHTRLEFLCPQDSMLLIFCLVSFAFPRHYFTTDETCGVVLFVSDQAVPICAFVAALFSSSS